MKKLLSVITMFAVSIMILQSTVFALNETITVHNTADKGLFISIGNEQVDLGDSKIFIDENGRTQLPVRAVAELLNAKVEWNGANKTVTVSRDNNTLLLTIGSKTMYRNGEVINMDSEAVIVEDKTYIPFSYIGEGLGCLVVYTEGNEPFKGQLHQGIEKDFFNHMN